MAERLLSQIIMNKCIMQNWKVFNRIKFYPMDDLGLDFKEPIESQEWSEKQWNYIVNNENLERHAIYTRKLKENKYTITLWSDADYLYLIQVIRGEYNENNTTVLMTKNTSDNLSDFKNIAKFIHKNITEIISGSRKNVAEFIKLKAAYDEYNKTAGEA